MADEVRYDQRGRMALITLNRPRYGNAQNSAMTYALDAAIARAVNDDQVAVLVLAGAGPDLMGMRPGMDSVFALHHLAHAHNVEVSDDPLAGLDGRGMKQAAR